MDCTQTQPGYWIQHIKLAGVVGVTLASGWLLGRFDLHRATFAPSSPLECLERESVLLHPDFFARLIRVGPPDYRFNCHGWTFLDGKDDMIASSVDALVESGRLQPVSKPRLGDVILYRDQHGQVMHSGRVQAVGCDGLVLVESKWGPFGRYLHLPDLPRNAASWQYYRDLEDVELDTDAVAASSDDTGERTTAADVDADSDTD